jgi:hypothetical protein
MNSVRQTFFPQVANDLSQFGWSDPAGTRGGTGLSYVADNPYSDPGKSFYNNTASNNAGIANFAGIGTLPVAYSEYHNANIVGNPWTLEVMIKIVSPTIYSASRIARLYDSGPSIVAIQNVSSNTDWRLTIRLSEPNDSNGSTSFSINLPNFVGDEWKHVVVSCERVTGTQFKFYAFVDGVLQGTHTYSQTLSRDLRSHTVSGAYLFTTESFAPYQFYVDNVRMVKGLPFPLGGFAPPTFPFNQLPGNSIVASTKLLMRFDSTPGMLVDSSLYSSSTTASVTAGTAVLSTEQQFWGDSALKLSPGSQISVNGDFPYYGQSDYTVEWRIYITSLTNTVTMLRLDGTGGVSLYVTTDGSIGATFFNSTGSAGGQMFSSAGAVAAGQWYYMAFNCRTNNQGYSFYLNNTRIYASSDQLGIPTFINTSNPVIIIGQANNNSILYFDELKVSNISVHSASSITAMEQPLDRRPAPAAWSSRDLSSLANWNSTSITVVNHNTSFAIAAGENGSYARSQTDQYNWTALTSLSSSFWGTNTVRTLGTHRPSFSDIMAGGLNGTNELTDAPLLAWGVSHGASWETLPDLTPTGWTTGPVRVIKYLGSRWVVAGGNSNQARLVTSSVTNKPTTWTNSNIGTALGNAWALDVAYNNNSSAPKWVVVGYIGYYATNNTTAMNPANWTAGNLLATWGNTNSSPFAVTYNPVSQKFVIGGQNGRLAIADSATTSTWTDIPDLRISSLWGTATVRQILWDSANSRMIALGSDGRMAISARGESWQIVNSLASSVAFGTSPVVSGYIRNNSLVVAGANKVHLSGTLNVNLPLPPAVAIGSFWAAQGGYYAGAVQWPSGEIYDLVIAPKDNWLFNQWQTTNVSITVTAASAIVMGYDGLLATEAFATQRGAGAPAAFAVSNLNLNGFTDWYVPSITELYEVYRNFKPTTQSNSTFTQSTYSHTSLGITADNMTPRAVGGTFTGTATNPAQTTVAEYISPGGSQHFGGVGYVWASTPSMDSAGTSDSSFGVHALVFDWAGVGGSGPDTGYYDVAASKTNTYRTIPMRRVLRTHT